MTERHLAHQPSEACGEEHCYSCNVDEPGGPAYRVCFECGHVWRTATDVLAAHNRHVMEYPGNVPETDPVGVLACPLCIHDW